MSSVTLTNPLNLTVPQFSCLKLGCENSAYLRVDDSCEEGLYGGHGTVPVL